MSIGTYPTETAAWDALAGLRTDTARGRYAGGKPVTVTLLQLWDALAATKTDSKPSTVKDRADFRKNLLNRVDTSGRVLGIGHIPAAEITELGVRAWLARLAADGMSISRRQKALTYLGQVTALSVRQGHAHQDAAEGVPVASRAAIKAGTGKPKFFATAEELVALTVHAQDRRLMVEVLAWSGIRQGELRAMAPEQVDRNRPLVYVTHTMSTGSGEPGTVRGTYGAGGMERGPTKAGSERRVRIPTPVWERLREYALSTPTGEPLWPSRISGSWLWPNSYIERVWTPAVDAAIADGHPGLGGTPGEPAPGRRRRIESHDVRATHASLLFLVGVTRPEVQAQLGHASSSLVTDLYTEVAAWGAEDPIGVPLRGLGLTLPDAVDALHAAAWAKYGPDPDGLVWW